MKLKDRYGKTIEYFLSTDPNPETELEYSDPFELIVAVILSAQCTDKRVNMITPPLMAAFPTPAAMAKATPSEIFGYIKTCSYPNNKAKHLSGMSKMLVERFNSKIPDDPEVLQQLPGVGRKTANVIASVVFRKPVMAVDTHVFRVSKRIGLTAKAKTPLEAELELTRNIPAELMHKAHHWLLLHGRYVCKARKPDCQICGLKVNCNYYLKQTRLMRDPAE
jgi:endonuclease-3